MKTLYIVRHAKSSWDEPGLKDEDRPLLEKGQRKTKRVVSFLQKHIDKIDLIMCSHTVRAHQTARIIAKSLNYPVSKIRIEKAIYHADDESIMDLIYDLPENIDSLMLVGHNPSITSLANRFLSEKIEWLPTSGVAALRFHTDQWENIELAQRETLFVIYPKMLK